MIEILIGAIFVIELIRLVSVYKKETPKSHFKGKLQGTQKMLWDYQFKKFKTLEIRESIRQEYDFMKSRLATLDGQISQFPEDGNKDEKARLDDQRALAQRDADRLEKQLQALDLEVYGSKPTNQYPEGVIGIEDNIKSIIELIEMIKNHLKKL